MNTLIRLFIAFSLLSLAVVLRAEDLGTVQKRMQDRQGAVDALKQREVAGENNRGFLEARGAATGADHQVVSAENSDRGFVYAELAKRSGTSTDTVGRARAKKIAEISTKGIWLQDEGGRWYKK